MNQIQMKETSKCLMNLPMIIGGLDEKATLEELKQIEHYLYLIIQCNYKALQELKQYIQALAEKYKINHLLSLELWSCYDDEPFETESLQNFHYSEELLEFLVDGVSKCILSTSQSIQEFQEISNEVEFEIEALEKMLSPEEQNECNLLIQQFLKETDDSKRRQIFKKFDTLRSELSQKYLGGSKTIQ